MTRMQIPGNPCTRLPLGSQLYCWILKKQPLFVGHKPQLTNFTIFYPMFFYGRGSRYRANHPWISYLHLQRCGNNTTKLVACCFFCLGTFPEAHATHLAAVLGEWHRLPISRRKILVGRLQPTLDQRLPPILGPLLSQRLPLCLREIGLAAPGQGHHRKGHQVNPKCRRHPTSNTRGCISIFKAR